MTCRSATKTSAAFCVPREWSISGDFPPVACVSSRARKAASGLTLDPPATPPRHPPLRLLYVCYLTLDDPLTHTQVVAYLAGLAKAGHSVHLLTFEPGLTRPRRRRWRRGLRSLGVAWPGLRYPKRTPRPATSLSRAAPS